MGRDTTLYRDAEVFDPTRFLGLNPEQDPGAYVWGFGRRVCPGRMVAESVIFTTFATVLATLQVSPVVEDGVVVLPEFKPSGEPMK